MKKKLNCRAMIGCMNCTDFFRKSTYRNAEFVGEVAVDEAAGDAGVGGMEVRLGGGGGGGGGGEGGGVAGGVERRGGGGVCEGGGAIRAVVVGEVEEVVDDEMVGGFGVGEALLRRELGVGVEEFRVFHWGISSNRLRMWRSLRNRSGMCVFPVCEKIGGEREGVRERVERRGVRLWRVREARGGVYLRFKGDKGEGSLKIGIE